jgi:hypothetical protein
MSFCSTIRSPAAAEACMPSIPGNPSGKPCVAIEAAKNTLVISQVKRPLGEINPSASKALSGYVEVTSFKLIPTQRVLGQMAAGSVAVTADILLLRELPTPGQWER